MTNPMRLEGNVACRIEYVGAADAAAGLETKKVMR